MSNYYSALGIFILFSDAQKGKKKSDLFFQSCDSYRGRRGGTPGER
jgi:hypothetical protein